MVRPYGLSKQNYGRFRFNGFRWMSHKFSYSCFYGEIPENLLICHTCDNPPCVNPYHLYAGTDLDNMNDRDLRDRTARGERNGFSKLNEKDIYKIRELLPFYNRQEIANIFNVSRSAIFRIQNKTTWSHVK